MDYHDYQIYQTTVWSSRAMLMRSKTTSSDEIDAASIEPNVTKQRGS